jgi:hypothetical protein
MATSALARGGRQATVSTRDNIIEKIRRWVELYGSPPRAADWNPSSAKWTASEEWRVERYRAGDPETGEPWPSLNAAKKPFGGSLNEAIRAAGFEPNKPGPPNRRTAVERIDHVQMDPAVRVAMAAAHQDVKAAGKRVEQLERMLERARAGSARLIEERDAARRVASRTRVVTRTKTKTKTKVVHKGVSDAALVKERERSARAVERVEARLADAREALEAARAAEKEAKASATRAASKLERAEATIHSVREDKHDAIAEAKRAGIAEDVAVAELAAAREEIARLRADTRVIVKDAPEQAAIDAALAEAAQARRDAHRSEVKAAEAERGYRELAVAVTGEERRLTEAEVKELRDKGPAGPAVLADALKALAKARATNSPVLLRAALTKVASAAVSWRERL